MSGSPESALRADLLSRLQLLQTSVRELARSVRRGAGDWWAWRAPEGTQVGAFDGVPTWSRAEALDRIIEAITTIDYDPSQSSVDALMFPGLVCVADETRELVREVNHRKSAFESAARAMSGMVREDWSEQKQRVERLSLLRYALRRAGAAHVNYWHAVREFVVFDDHPRLASYTWIHSQEVTTRTVAQVWDDLREQLEAGIHSESIERDLLRLAELPATELLARKMTWSAHPRVNFVFETPRGTVRLMRRGSLPIFLPGARLPMFRPLAAAPLPRGYRAKRSDSRLEPDPYLESTPLYRFRAEHRRHALPAEQEGDERA